MCVLLACWMPPGPGLVLLLCWPQRPRSAVAPALRTRPCHTGTRPPAAVNAGHFSPDADGRPKTGCRRLPLACRPSRYPSARPGMTHREERGPCADGLKAPITPIIFPVRRRAFGPLGGAYQPVMRGSGARRGGPEQCADQPTRRVTGGSERTQAAVQVWRVWAAIVPQRSLWCANWQVEARVTYRRRRSDLCLTGILPSDVMFLTGSAGGLSAC